MAGAISDAQSFEGKAMSATEEAVLGQARMRAIYRGENEVMATTQALDAIAKLRESLQGDEYQQALDRLLAEYSKS